MPIEWGTPRGGKVGCVLKADGSLVGWGVYYGTDPETGERIIIESPQGTKPPAWGIRR